MTATVEMQSEYRNLPIIQLQESPANPRRVFEDAALQELASFVSGHKIGLLFRGSFCCR